MDVLHTTRIAPVQQTVRLSRFAPCLGSRCDEPSGNSCFLCGLGRLANLDATGCFQASSFGVGSTVAGKSVLSRPSFRR